MKTLTLSPTALVLALVLACCCTVPALAQYDSSRLDLGYLPLNRDLTQTITIKGVDLEKMPFANLSDAIAAWLYGAYTPPATLQYFVDGSPVADVNAYSVFDIEEVVLVENAAAMGYTGGSQQQVVWIQTRRGKAKSGMTAAVQTGLVNGGIKGLSTDTRWYHQYYLGANINPGSWRFEASASWLRDIMPTSTADQIVTPDNLQRWRLHGYADWQPDRHEQLELSVGYVPEKFRSKTDSMEQQDFVYGVTNAASQHFFLPELKWRGEWLGGLTNQLQASYVQSVYQGGQVTESFSDTSSQYNYTDSVGGDRSSYHVYVRDRLAYRLAAGGWQIEPAINASYEHVNERFNYIQYMTDNNGPGLSNYSDDEGYSYDKYHVLFYTPQLDIHYKRGFDLVGGEMFQAGLKELPGAHKSFFFISSSFDVLRLAKENSPSGLAFFGSYTQRASPPSPGYQLADLTYGYSNENLFGSNNSFAFIGSPYIFDEAIKPSQRFWVWEAGVRYTGWKDRVQIQGNVERRNDALLNYIYVPYGIGFSLAMVNVVATDILLHVDARVKILQENEAGWESGINATILRNKVNDFTTVTADGTLAGYTGDVYPNPWSVTGGWINRVQAGHFIGGLDLVYHFGETYFKTGPGTFPVVTSKSNPVAVPNIYAGYRIGPAHTGLEIFVESRGLFRSNPSDLAESRRYYTVGGKWSL
jgi:hypothetical protein